MEENNFLFNEVFAPPSKRVLTDEQKTHAKSLRQQKRFERQQNPEEDKAFKDKHNSYNKNLSDEKRESNKSKRAKLNAEKNALKSIELIEGSEDAIEKYEQKKRLY
jgi:CRISPR/Cas system CMR subunit Cmr6 (Cas7 group RAMP superfamily)